ncbi:hypothetical protein [Gynurincola endophyticus]|uniref:hypothetical protein n=1 Tax=Gynurincola endophyticus TaxID=2479004 RepID=UPI000F8DDD01|nr:hypothetical protein [Gynurincola endophyticus]
MKFYNSIYFLFFFLLLFNTACENKSSLLDNSILPENKEVLIDEAFELSYWVDIDVRHNNGRGYWFNRDVMAEDITPTEQEINHSVKALALDYRGNKLYVTYHRQFEIDKAKAVFQYWRLYGDQYNIEIVPTIVLETYATPATMNFTNSELVELAEWCKTNINSKEFGIYDVYVRQSSGSIQDLQLEFLKQHVPIDLVRVGIQPGERLNSYYTSGVQDTWSAECHGITNELWEFPRYYKGTNNYGRKLLEDWVNARINEEKRKIIWNLIPVAWDYDEPLDPFSYIFPGDNALTNDPPIPGRLILSKDYIISWYAEGTSNQQFGGFSCDLHILEANSYGKPESPTFYDRIRNNQPYEGYFSEAMKEIGEVYQSLSK